MTDIDGKWRVGTFEGSFYAFCSLLVWLAFAGFVFLSSCITVASRASSIPWSGWAFVVGVSLVPILLVTFLAIRRLRNPPFIPTTLFSRQIFWVQIAGMIGLAAAVASPPFLLSSYLNPGGMLQVENQTGYRLTMRLFADLRCSGGAYIEPRTATEANLRIGGEFEPFDCWGAGSHLTELEVSYPFGTWSCEWPIDDPPLVLRDSGPSCNTPYFEPSLINPPVSPPAADPSPLSTPVATATSTN